MMQAPNPPDIADKNRPQGLTGNYTVDPSRPDEMTGPDGALRPHWRGFVSSLDELGPEELRRRWDHARRLIHENGVTHNVYGDPNGLDRPGASTLFRCCSPRPSGARFPKGWRSAPACSTA